MLKTIPTQPEKNSRNYPNNNNLSFLVIQLIAHILNSDLLGKDMTDEHEIRPEGSLFESVS